MSRPPKKILRSKHYVVLTNSGVGRSLLRQLEQTYREVQTRFPFAELRQRRLLPVLVLRHPNSYLTLRKGRPWQHGTQGFATRDYYVTWYVTPRDRVHRHEATHQLFANRLFLAGGGAWFQEGIAEYLSTSRQQRAQAAASRRRSKTPSVSLLMTLGTLQTGASPDEVFARYRACALLMEFALDSRSCRSKALQFIHAAGSSRPLLYQADIQALVHEVYGITRETWEQQFADYCRRR